MRLWTLLTSLTAAVALATLALPGQAAVKDTKHNMNLAFGANTIQDNQVCLPCHAPHNQPAGAADTVGTLWNHVMPSNSYKLYDNTNVGGFVEGGLVVGLDDTSKKCLSCHDGSVAVDSYGGYTFKPVGQTSVFANTDGTHKLGTTNDINGASTAGFVVGSGGDLSHDHPVGVQYPATGYNDPSLWTRTGYTKSGVVVNYVKPGGAAGGSVAGGGFTLEGGNVAGVGVVGCGTCHTPHGDTYNFLTINNDNSQLCSTCHTR